MVRADRRARALLAYGRSFGPPQYLQLLVAPDDLQLQAETSNGVELGAKLLELAGLYGEVTGWYKEFTNYIDVGEESYDAIPKIHIWGVESELEWYPSEVFDADFGEPRSTPATRGPAATSWA
ncbi:TonB-dependent receptor [Pseudenhygromyxa sp. WMMC2535]|uniref:TonB-dependent receptor domain-containing protein n=1 Tax=Pseudenhygromyxa sp. WMMC2535 TaxID=2712867 RepID=UPI001596303A|nr:TonB-dependent receptor [Pseudenhygromyxa sp. WMMC2535]